MGSYIKYLNKMWVINIREFRRLGAESTMRARITLLTILLLEKASPNNNK
jgi:hypothetical protein